jgi:hypothetical protein
VATLWRFESSLGHQDIKKVGGTPAFFHLCAQEAKRLRALREDSKGRACKRGRGRARVTESSLGHQDIKKVGGTPAFFHLYAQEAKRLRALREDSKGRACKRSRGRACVTESSSGHQDFKKVGGAPAIFLFVCP